MEYLFWIAILLVLHTYVLYPLILTVFSYGKKGNLSMFEKEHYFSGQGVT